MDKRKVEEVETESVDKKIRKRLEEEEVDSSNTISDADTYIARLDEMQSTILSEIKKLKPQAGRSIQLRNFVIYSCSKVQLYNI